MSLDELALDDQFRCQCERFDEGDRPCTARATQEDMLCDPCRQAGVDRNLNHVGPIYLGKPAPHMTIGQGG